jgi:hypothetical protein
LRVQVASTQDGQLSHVTIQLLGKDGAIHYEKAIAAGECQALG